MKRNGYILKHCSNHPRADSSGYVYEHILVAERILGRHLTEEEVVHHIDKNRTNNDPTNLMIFATDSEHHAFHKGSQAWTNDVVWHASKKTTYKKCLYCGKLYQILSYEHLDKRKYCSVDCYNKDNDIHNKDKLQNIQNLLVKNNGNFSAVARILNVSSSGLAKLLKQNGLPYHSKNYKSNSGM